MLGVWTPLGVIAGGAVAEPGGWEQAAGGRGRVGPPWWGAVAGFFAGGAVAVLAYVPGVPAVRRWWGVPSPPLHPGRTTPLGEVAASYWGTWAACLLVLALPGLVLLLFRPTRWAAVGFLLGAMPVGLLWCAFVVGFDLSGFTPG